MSAQEWLLKELMQSETGGGVWNEDCNAGFEFQRLGEGLSSGVDQVTLRLGQTSVVVVPTRGMGIARAERDGVRFGWDSPVAGPVHPSLVPVFDPGGLGWLEGFDELLVRCGLTSNGAPEFDVSGRLIWPLHGRIANVPAQDVRVALSEHEGWIEVSGTVCESRFHFTRLVMNSTIRLEDQGRSIRVVDRVTNESDRPAAIQMLYHVNFGPPLLGQGARVVGAFRTVVARDKHAASGIDNWFVFSGPDPTYREEVYFADIASDNRNKVTVALINDGEDVAASLVYDRGLLPCFALWKNTVGMADGYVAGLEPGTNFPNIRSFEAAQGRVLNLAPHESVEFELQTGLHTGKGEVSELLRGMRENMAYRPELIRRTGSPWSPGDV